MGARFGINRGKSHGFLIAFACLALVASGGCSKSDADKAEKSEKSDKTVKADPPAKPAAPTKSETAAKAEVAVFDTSRLPRVSGAKQVFASPATTIFTSPEPVAQTAATVEKALAAAGWQEYVAPNTARADNPSPAHRVVEEGHAGPQRVHHDRAGAEQRHQRAIRRGGAENRSAVPQGRQQYRILPGPAVADLGHRHADRADAGVLSPGAGLARLVAVVAKAERRSTGGRHSRRADQERWPMPTTCRAIVGWRRSSWNVPTADGSN